MKRKTPKKRCPIAASLREPSLRPKVVPDKKKAYSRKGRQSKDWRSSSFIIADPQFSLFHQIQEDHSDRDYCS